MVLGDAEVIDGRYNGWWPFKKDGVLDVSSHPISDLRWHRSQAIPFNFS